jgi:hypothetical protein
VQVTLAGVWPRIRPDQPGELVAGQLQLHDLVGEAVDAEEIDRGDRVLQREAAIELEGAQRERCGPSTSRG